MCHDIMVAGVPRRTGGSDGDVATLTSVRVVRHGRNNRRPDAQIWKCRYNAD